MKILITSPAFCQPGLQNMVEYAKTLADEVIVNPYGRTLKTEELRELWKNVDGIVAGVEDYSPDVLQQAPESLKVISRYGAGYNTVDLEEAGKRGIKVTNTPGVNAPAVAELTMGLLLSIARKIPQYDAKTRNGEWSRYVGVGLVGKTIGIIGLGAIGKAVAVRAKGFSMDVLAYDPYFDEDFAGSVGINQASLDEIYEKADVLTIHVPVMKETEGMINADVFRKMKKTALFINAARGQLMDQDALYDALKNNEIGGAGIDVFEKEPLLESPLFSLDNIVVSPHLAGFTEQSVQLMGKCSIDNTVEILKGKECKNVVNTKYL